MVVATASAYYFSARQAKQYEAAASLIYEKSVDVANPLSEQYTDTYALDREMSAISDIIASPDIAEARRRHPRRSRASTTPPATRSAPARRPRTLGRQRQQRQQRGAHLGHQRGPGAGRRGRQRLRRGLRGLAQGAPDGRRSRRPPTPSKAQLDEYPEAAQQTADYLMLKQRLQDLVISKATATGNYRVLVRATVPTAPFAPNPLARRHPRPGRRPVRRHRPRLPARAVRYAPAEDRRDREGAARAHPRPHPAHRAQGDPREHPGHAGAPRRARRRGVPHGAHQPRLPQRRRRHQVAGRHQLRAGRGQERRRGQPRRLHGAGRQEGHRRRRRPAAPAAAQVLRARATRSA